jgi:hypothetical protein
MVLDSYHNTGHSQAAKTGEEDVDGAHTPPQGSPRTGDGDASAIHYETVGGRRVITKATRDALLSLLSEGDLGTYVCLLCVCVLFWFIGLLVYWFIGLLVYWFQCSCSCSVFSCVVSVHVGVLKYWCIGVLECWNADMLVSSSAGVCWFSRA